MIFRISLVKYMSKVRNIQFSRLISRTFFLFIKNIYNLCWNTQLANLIMYTLKFVGTTGHDDQKRDNTVLMGRLVTLLENQCIFHLTVLTSMHLCIYLKHLCNKAFLELLAMSEILSSYFEQGQFWLQRILI